MVPIVLPGIWSHEQMFEARPDVMYEKIAADTMMDSWKDYEQTLWQRRDLHKLSYLALRLNT